MNAKLQTFVTRLEQALDAGQTEPVLVETAAQAMADLVAMDDWLADEFAQPHPTYYQQYLLHCDAQQRFSVVSFVWGPGQRTPVHDHMAWGAIGMLRGSERAQAFTRTDTGLVPHGEEEVLLPGSVSSFSPSTGDIHQVRNAFDDRVSISIHVYGTDIGQQKRHVFDPATGAAKEFVSGYSNHKAPG